VCACVCACVRVYVCVIASIAHGNCVRRSAIALLQATVESKKRMESLVRGGGECSVICGCRVKIGRDPLPSVFPSHPPPRLRFAHHFSTVRRTEDGEQRQRG
jgi:hypothetical protein